MARIEVEFGDYDAECLTFLREHFNSKGEHVAISDFPRYEELGRDHVMKVIDRYRRLQMIEFLSRGTITILPQLISVADQLRVPQKPAAKPFGETLDLCVSRLAKIYENGIARISVNELFDDMDVEDDQKYTLCKSLEARQVIKPTYQLGQKLPYIIDILPYAVQQRDRPSPSDISGAQHVPRTAWDAVYKIAQLWFGDPSARFAKFFAIAGVALIAAPWWQPVLQHFAVRHIGVRYAFLANADRAMFLSGWCLIAIALGLYIWIKRLQVKETNDAK